MLARVACSFMAILHASASCIPAQAAPYFVWYLPSPTPFYPLLVINPDNKPYYRCTLQLFRTYTKRDGSQGFDTRNYYFSAPPNAPVSPGIWNSQEHGGNTITSTNVYCSS
ncbi:hypothetical protein MOX02_48230 [Methylobacterium oxalidis]|uniref:Secreted protein n=1 Tax=Methylobacterium oxalidis TaxID=944322 RepID=A0A512JA26_9HYPH|nr:hypothetical protein MOX02_48230 [Methylobacterium oxalidis]GJE34465.1 hypothetical protein LDDCCGHA_4676 [Methylobacterium oxalidis]GLS67089.1 hypothetical protein GCM10007888_54720 [Methylobacterium oxalidis]